MTRDEVPADGEAKLSITSHVVVTPARNEADNLRRLAQSLIEQTWRPATWLVVDNGSTDGTAEVVAEFARDHDWIRLITIPSDAAPTRGRSSIRAFNTGIADLPELPDLVTGLDADVSFGPEYFRGLRRAFTRNDRLGIAAGQCYEPSPDGWEPIHVTRPNLRGASLTYRRECLEQLLPLEGRFAWDGIVVVRANIRGWETALLPDIRYFHHRPTGGRDRNRFASFAEEGESAYYMWYRPSYLLLRTLYRAIGARDPAATALLWGYARSALGRAPRHADPGFREFVRSMQSPVKWASRGREVTGRA